MKEESNENRWTPSANEMNDMYKDAWLGFHADAQEARQDLNRRYRDTVKTYGSYKNMPHGLKEIWKQEYTQLEEKWGDNGAEMQKRFGANEPDPTKEQKQPEPAPSEPVSDREQRRQEFLQQAQQQREQQKTRGMEYDF